MCRPMILGWCTVRLSSRTQGGIRCPGFFGAASAFLLVSDLVSASSEDLAGAGVTGVTTGTAVERSSTITNGSRTAGTSVMRDSITVISATAALTTVASATATRSTVVPAITLSQEHTPARSVVALTTAETSEAFRRAGGRALVVASMEVVPMAVAGTRDARTRGQNLLRI